jgi:hypothetical protein
VQANRAAPSTKTASLSMAKVLVGQEVPHGDDLRPRYRRVQRPRLFADTLGRFTDLLEVVYDPRRE